ncbi:2'-5' RNA ligase family protein [Pedobacter sp. Hv1]|uniref:2'-5' RNA ligase family protein n=1 Tax=Pedobacter sp. Hv1 TaxID=1740090 RepID=UPI0006D8B828|nr:2'-5' RNA ligase family protein [Pedobacter sp. Hv1]KQC00363.1 hypothetical protein AQF98_12820 [Pedobacter sp. Hv1]
MNYSRRQLTLFLRDQNDIIEKIRAEFNPIQQQLIAAHVTLCREDEIEPIALVLQNIKAIILNQALSIEFNSVARFDNGKGVLLPASVNNNDFHELRKKVLKGLNDSPRIHSPHLTLMHPRNSTCTDEIFEKIKQHEFPTMLYFDQISLIEQKSNEKWIVIDQFPFT